MRVLVADDSAIMRQLLKTTLEGWGYRVEIAEDGTRALEVLESDDPPQIAVLDWQMPGASGPEICRKARARQGGPYTYILLLTSRGERQDIVQGLGAGADDYVVKPFDIQEFEVRLRAGRRIVDLQLELMTVQEALRYQATRDGLTNLWNRFAIQDILERELLRGRRESSPVGILMVDLDNFKQVNDTLGHAAGDALLVEIAQRVVGSIRAYDSVGRIGGEEFLVVLPGCAESGIEGMAERIRAAVAADPAAWEGNPVPLTASLGATSAPPEMEIGAEELIRIADAAMYEAKRRGRDRVVFRTAGKCA
jgi:diguanylate cyclase (GGDEF)-like protein